MQNVSKASSLLSAGKRPREVAFDPAIENMLARIPIFASKSRLLHEGAGCLVIPAKAEIHSLIKALLDAGVGGHDKKIATAALLSL
jgi:hypothetical protein